MVASVVISSLLRHTVAPWSIHARGARGYMAGVLPGIVTVAGAPAAREVECRHRLTRTPVARTFAAPDGSYRFDGLPLDEQYDVIGRDFAGYYNDTIWSRGRAEPYSVIDHAGAFTAHDATRTLAGAIDIIGGETGHTVDVVAGAAPPGITFSIVTAGMPVFDYVSRWLIASGTTVAGSYTWALRVSAPDGSSIDISCSATFT